MGRKQLSTIQLNHSFTLAGTGAFSGKKTIALENPEQMVLLCKALMQFRKKYV
jgi:hypothetical protein